MGIHRRDEDACPLVVFTLSLLFFRLVNESLQMLARYPEVNTKILPLMEDYLVALRFVIMFDCLPQWSSCLTLTFTFD